MSANSEIIGIGKFRKELKPFLEYPSDWYDDTEEGKEIVTIVWTSLATSGESRDLANAVGVIFDDFNTHLIDAKKISWNALAESLCNSENFDNNMERLKIFSEESSFKLFFRPNC